MIMIMGILSFFVAGPILGPISWIMGRNDLIEMKAGRMDPEGESQTRAGMICGMISTIMCIVGLALALLWVIFVFACCGAGMISSGGGGGGGY